MEKRADIAAWLRLTLTPGVPLAQQLALLTAFQTAERVFTADVAEVTALVGQACAATLAKGPVAGAVDDALAWIEAPNHHFLTLGDDAYPEALRNIACPPVALYVQGRLDLLGGPAFAVVGSRNATINGVRDADSLSHALSHAGFAIVSGLALGIDAAAHRGGLRAEGSSVAFLGTGADRIYPKRNHDLAHELAERGALVSEFPLGTAPAAGNFPRRNRLISGLARGVLVVEAAVQSGSLITARFAAEQGRDVFAVPGSIHSPLSRGCHQLIKEGAKLVESAEDILTELNWHHAAPPDAGSTEATRDPLLKAMGHAPVSIDQIAEHTGQPVSAIAARLSLLELEGAVTTVAGGYFQRVASQ